MQAANSDEEVRQLLDSPEFEFRFDCGICQPSQSLALTDRDTIVSSIALHHTIYSCRSELDEFTVGLSALNFQNFMRQNEVLRSLFEHSESSLTADLLQDLFVAEFSPAGSNARTAEEAATMFFYELLHDIEGKDFYMWCT